MALKNIKSRKNQSGFTIVELLIVIVVIAILATISIVAYNGVQARARTSAGQQLASQIAKKFEAYNAVNGAYPTTRAQIQGTPESTIDGLAASGLDPEPILLGASDELFGSGTLDAGTAGNGKAVLVDGTAGGGLVYYWDYMDGGLESISYGDGTPAP